VTISARLLPPRGRAARPTPKTVFAAFAAAAALAFAALASLPATAGAIVTSVAGHAVGLQPRNLELLHEGNAVFVGNKKVLFEPFAETFENAGGHPVLHGSNVYVIYWDPTAHYHGDWKNVIDTFFNSVGNASETNDVFEVNKQYTDKSNVPAQNQLVFRGAYTDTRPYPSSKCVDPAPMKEQPWSHVGPLGCLTAEQMEFEVTSFITKHGLPKGMNTVYYLLTPPGLTTCLDEGGPTGHCSSFSSTAEERETQKFESESYEDSFCSYHADVNPGGLETGDANTILYAVVPWIAGGEGDGQFAGVDKTEAAYCQDGGFDPSSKPIEQFEELPELTAAEKTTYEKMNAVEKAKFDRERELKAPHEQEPNQVTCPSPDGYCDTGLADLIINQIAVQQQNIVTDPLLNSWHDLIGNEATDECRNFFAFAEGGGSTANPDTGAGTLYNQQISGHLYYLNDAFNLAALKLNYPGVPCLHGIDLEPEFTAPNTVNAGDTVSFDAGESNITLEANSVFTESGEAKPHYAVAKWNFGDGTPEVSGSAPGSPPCEEPWLSPCAESVFHAYQYGGAYTVTLTVTDVGGVVASTAQTVNVVGPPAPPKEGAAKESSTSPGSSGGSTPGTAGGGKGGGGRSVPAPVATMAVVSHSLKTVLSKGLGVRYSVNEQVAGHFEVLLSSKLAKHLKISGALAKGLPVGAEPQVVIGTALVVTLKGGKSTAHVILTKGAAKRLHNMKSLSGNLRLVVHNAATVSPASTTVINAFRLGR
jgi:hypothetical protein